MEDNEVIFRCLAGEREAFGMIVNKYQSGILSLAWSLLGNSEEARDATQEVFVQAYKNLTRFNHSRSFKNWIYAIAYKRCADSRRKARFLKKFMQRVAQEGMPGQSDVGPEQRVEESEILSRLMKRLRLKERLVFLLSTKEGYSAAEIADVLCCSESTARVYLFNARMKLRKLLERNKHVQTP